LFFLRRLDHRVQLYCAPGVFFIQIAQDQDGSLLGEL
jgi:hypothetical protein